MEQVYVHEDRLGPYARMTWTRPGTEEAPALVHEAYPGAKYSYAVAPMRVLYGIVPLYPKMRLSARGLLDTAASVFPWLLRRLADRSDELRVDLRFVGGTHYGAELLRSGLEPADRIARFARNVMLPRYVGLVRCHVADGAFLDFVCDTTDIHRDEPKFGSLLAVVGLTNEASAWAHQFVNERGLSASVVAL